jgi:hypothetical protein
MAFFLSHTFPLSLCILSPVNRERWRAPRVRAHPGQARTPVNQYYHARTTITLHCTAIRTISLAYYRKWQPTGWQQITESSSQWFGRLHDFSSLLFDILHFLIAYNLSYYIPWVTTEDVDAAF